MFKTSLRSVVVAASLAAASVAAHADIAINTYLDFEGVTSGSTANAYLLGKGISSFTFGNADRVDDAPVYDSIGNLLNDGAFHWVDASATYGAVKVLGDAAAVSGSNVLSNDYAPILVQFTGPVNLASFSVQLDKQNYGFFTDTIQFLDNTGHVIAGKDLVFSSYQNPGLTVSSGPVNNVSAILLSATSRNFDNLSITTQAAAVPEPASYALLLAGVAALGVVARRRAA